MGDAWEGGDRAGDRAFVNASQSGSSNSHQQVLPIVPSRHPEQIDRQYEFRLGSHPTIFDVNTVCGVADQFRFAVDARPAGIGMNWMKRLFTKSAQVRVIAVKHLRLRLV